MEKGISPSERNTIFLEEVLAKMLTDTLRKEQDTPMSCQ
jgi:hypothetical protein